MVGASEQGSSLNISRTTQERFVYNLGILDSLVDEDKDDDFTKNNPVRSIADLLDQYPPNEVGRFEKFSEYFRYWTRIDVLMRRQGFYTTRKNVSHL